MRKWILGAIAALATAASAQIYTGTSFSTVQGPDTKVNLDMVGDSHVDTGLGASGPGTQRVAISSDSSLSITIPSVTIAISSVQAAQLGSYTVTPGTGAWNVSGSSVVAYQGGTWNISTTVTPSTSTIVSTGSITSFQGGAWNVGQVGPYTVTPGTGVWSVSGSSIIAYQGGNWNITATVMPSTSTIVSTGSITSFQGGTWNVGQAGSYTVTPGSGTFPVSGSVSVSNFPGTQPVSGTVSALQSGSYTVTPGTGTFAISGAVTAAVNGSTVAVTNVNGQNLNVAVSNFPASQAVTGNFNTGTYTVTAGTGTFTVGGSVSVSNFPATQPVSQSGSFTVTPGTGTWNTSGTVTVNGSTVAVTNVNGQNLNVAVSNFPATQSVTGSSVTIYAPNGNTTAIPVSGTFFQAVQPVSQNGSFTVTPGTGTWNTSGAVTVNGSTVAVTNVNGQNLNIAGAVSVSNFPAVQPVSQSGSFTVTPGTGTFPISGSINVNGSTVAVANVAGSTLTVVLTNSSVSVSNLPAVQAVSQSGPWTVTPGTGTFAVSLSSVGVSGSTVSVVNAGGTNLSVVFPSAQSVSASQAGSYTVTPGSGTFPISGAVSQAGSYTVTPGTGNWSVNGSTLAVTNVSGQSLNVAVTNSPSVVASQSGSYTVTPGTGTWQTSPTGTQNVNIVSTFSSSNPGYVLAAQNGSYTVTAGTGTFPISGAVGQAGSYTVTPGTGSWSVNGSTLAITNVNGSTLTVVLTNSSVAISNVPQVTFSSGSFSNPLYVLSTNTAVGNIGGSAIGVVSTQTFNVTFASGSFSNPLYVLSTNTVVNQGTNPWTAILSTEAVLASTSGVIGSVSLGSSAGKSIVTVSSSVVTTATSFNPILSSYTVTTGKTFYLQYMTLRGFFTTPAGANTNLGIMVVTEQGVTLASTTFLNGGSGFYSLEQYNFAEPLPIPSGKTISAQAEPNSATSTTWITSFIGYEK